MIEPRRGEIWWAKLGTGERSEQQGTRPVLIIQNDVGNLYSPTVIVACITDRPKAIMPTHVNISKECGLVKDSTILLEQIRTISKSRLGTYIAETPQHIIEQVDHALGVSIGLIPAKSPKRA